MGKACKVIYNQGFNETKKWKYNNYINFLLGDVIIDLANDGNFVSLGSTITKNNADILYGLIYNKLSDRLYNTYESNNIIQDEDNLEEEVRNHYLSIINNKKSKKKDIIEAEQLLDIDYILTNFNDFRSYNIAKSKLSIEDKEEDELGDKFKDTVTDSGWDRSDFFIRNLFLTVPKIDKKGNVIIDKVTNLPILADGINLFNNLSKELSNSTDMVHFYSKLNSKSFKTKYPEVSYIAKFFPEIGKEYSNIDIVNATQFKTAFYQTLNKAYIPIVAHIKKDGKSYNAQLTQDKSVNIANNWSNQFNIQEESEFVKVIDSVNTFVKAPELVDTSKKNIEKYLSYFGIALDDKIYKDQKATLEGILLGNTDNKLGLVKLFKNYLESKQTLINPIESLKEVRNDGPGITLNRSLKALAKLESEYNVGQLSLTALNANGDLQSVISERNTFTIMLNTLNNAKNIEEVYQHIPALKYNILFQPGSFWYDNLFDQYGNRINNNILLTNTSGLLSEEDNIDSKVTSDMNIKEKLIYDLNMLVSVNSFIELPRTSTSDTYYATALTNNNRLNTESFRDVLLHYLNSEREAIKNNLQTKHYIFDTIPQDVLDNDEAFVNHVEKLFKNESKATINLIQDLSIIPSDIPTVYEQVGSTYESLYVLPNNAHILNITKEEFERRILQGEKLIEKPIYKINENKIEDALKRHFVNAVEASYLFTGNPASFKDFTKRFKGGLSTGLPMDTNPDVENLLDLDTVYGNQVTIAKTLGVERNDNSTQFKTKTFEDSEDKTEKTYKKLFKHFTKGLKDKVKIEVIERTFKAYKNINIADGQGLINLDFYREFLLKAGNWSNEKELAFIYEGLYYKKNVLKKVLSEQEKDTFDRVEKEVYYNNLDGKYSLPPLKAQYDGPHANIERHELNMDKFSLVPVLPSMTTNNPKWTKLIKDMAVNGIGYVKYESASKGFIQKVVPFGKGLDNPNELYSSMLKEQIRTASSLKSEVTWGTQFRKLLFGGLFNETNASPKIKELYNNYINILKSVAEDAKEALFKDLGVELDIDNKKLYIKDYEKLVSSLKDQAIKLEKSNAVIESLEYNEETGELLNLFETTGATSEINNMIFGMIDKKLRVWKTKGNQYIQVSNDTFENLAFYDLMDNKTTKAQCRVSLNGEFLKLLKLNYQGKPINTLENLNRAVKNKAWREQHQKHLTVIGYRIPTQEMNSMEYLEIVEFLPPTTGNIIQLYDEITGKAGSDFDIDKLSLMIPSFDEDGNYLDFDNKENLYDTYKNLVKDKQDLITEVNKYNASLRQEIKDVNKVKKDEISDIKDTLQILKIERDYYYELMAYELDKRNIVNYEDFIYTKASKILDDIFQQNSTELLGQDIIQYFTKLQEIEKSYNDIKFANEVNALIKQDNYHTIYEVKNEQLKLLFDKTETINKALYRLRNKKSLLTNSLIELYSEVFSQPESFEQLVRPNDASYINEIFEQNAIDTGEKTEKGLPKGFSVFRYLTNLSLHTRLKLAGKHLGIYATTNTSHAIANQVGLKLNRNVKGKVLRKNKETKKNELKDYELTIQLGLLTESEEVQVLKDDLVDMDQNFDVEGTQISSIISKLIDVTVDSEKNPQYLYANINNQNINMVIYLLRQGTPFKRIVQFISLPEIKEYFKQKEINPDIPYKPKDFPGLNYVDMHKLDVSKLESILKDKTNSADNLVYREQAYQLMLKLEKESKLFSKFTMHFTYDTKKINTPIALKEVQSNLETIRNSNFVNSKYTDLWVNETIISVFNNSELIKELSKEILPVLYNQNLVNNFYDTYKKADSLTSGMKVSLEKVLLQEYTQAIYEQFGIYNNQTIGKYGYKLASNQDLLERIRKIGKELPEFSIFKQLIPEGLQGTEIINLKLLRDLNNKSQQINILAEEIERLINYEESEDEEFNKLIQDTFKDFSILAIKQGFSKSRFYMEDIIPLSFKQDLYKDAVDNYLSFINNANKLEYGGEAIQNGLDEFYIEFENQFINNYKNRFFGTQIKNETESQLKDGYADYNQNVLGNRLNNYIFDDTLFKTLTPEIIEEMNIVDRKETELSNIQEQKKAEKKKETVVQNDKLKPSDYINHSGGAYGGDTFWDLIGREFGITNHKHYKDAGNANLSQQLRNKGVKAEILTKEQMDFARQKVKELLGIEYKDDLKGNLQVRNFYQVYNSDAVYAIAKINNDNKSVNGGTNTAIQLGIKLNKPVYVWDINTEKWNKFEPNLEDVLSGKTVSEFYEVETPTLTKNFAGIGSRDIENYNVQKEGKWQPREEYVGKEKEEKAKQAIRDVYKETLQTQEQPIVEENVTNNQNTQVQQLDKINDVKELALANKDRKVKVTFTTRKYDNTFEATVTGETEVISESFSKNDITGEISNYEKIEHLQLKTNTGKMITASEADIEGLIKTKPNEQTKIPPCAN